MKRLLIISWLTALCFLLLGNVHAWDLPAYVRVNSGARMWFSSIDGDLIQRDRTKLGFRDNMGLDVDTLSWEIYGSGRYDNVHVVNMSAETSTLYDGSANGSSQKTWNVKLGYDLDFVMTPQLLFGSNSRVSVVNLSSEVRGVTVGAATYDYDAAATRIVPSMGMHGTYFPIIPGISLRPSVSGRTNVWNYDGIEALEWQVTAGLDVPITTLWTWSINGGYQFSHMKINREQDMVDVNRKGFFLETSLLF